MTIETVSGGKEKKNIEPGWEATIFGKRLEITF